MQRPRLRPIHIVLLLVAVCYLALLRLYFGTVHDVHRARLALMQLMSDFREAMWAVVQQSISTLDFDYVAYAAKHFERMLTNARVEGFADRLSAARVPVR